MVSIYKLGSMSLGDALAAEAEAKGVDAEAAVRLHAQYKAKAAASSTTKFAPQLDSRYLSQNQAQHCWCVPFAAALASPGAPLPPNGRECSRGGTA
jgi:hypothetical protein